MYVDRPGLLDITGLDKEGIKDEDFLFKHIQEMEVRTGAFKGTKLLQHAQGGTLWACCRAAGLPYSGRGGGVPGLRSAC